MTSSSPVSCTSLECRFCSLAATDHGRPPRDQWVSESEHFVAFPSVGALVDGWIMVVPRQHWLSLSVLPPYLQRELEDMSAMVSSALEAEYGAAITQFEHGATEPMQSVGCGVDHAHLHLVPLEFDVIDATAAQFPDLRIQDHNGGIPAVNATAGGRSYVYMRNGDGRDALILNAEGESQLVRRVVSARLGACDTWNWREHPQEERADRCGRRLSSRGRLVDAAT